MNAMQNPRRRFLQVATLGAAGAFAGAAPGLINAQPSPPETHFGDEFLPTWQRARDYTIAFAKAMPDALYAFRPTAEVRTFSEQLLHLARTSSFFVNLIIGREEPVIDWESKESSSKVELIAILDRVFRYGDNALRNLTQEQEQATHELLRGQVTLTGKEIVLVMRDHVTHHRGQLVVYLRLNGIEPPQYVGF
jgi:uncharacterized damage-inducible protein DinB